MTYCTSCGTENADGTHFCTVCGATLPSPAPGAWGTSGDLGAQPPGGTGSSTPGYSPPSYQQYSPPQSGALNPSASGAAAYGQLDRTLVPAVWADRVLAALLDGALVLGGMVCLYIAIIILSFILGGIGAAIGGVTGGQEGAAAGGGLLGYGFCCVALFLLPLATLGIGLYNKVYLISKRGYSIGQGVMKLKVVTAQGDLVPIGTLVLRLLVQVGFGFIAFLSVLSLLWPLWDPQRQTLHDKAVGTFVIKTG